MTHRPRLVFCLPLLSLLIATPALAAATVIELSAEASRPAPNDLLRATVVAEATGTTPGELAKQVNTQIAAALKITKTYTAVKTQSGSTNTFPSYTKNGKIESWRMRSELSLESGDIATLSELLGKLQTTLAVSNIAVQPAPETRKKIENDAMLDALNAFKSRAKVIADALGKPYHIKQLVVSTGGGIVQPMFRAAAKSMMADTAPMPVEAGESQVSATVSGQIELE